MSELFFITGPPRFRGPWLANMFTYKDSYCFNTATKECHNIDELKALICSVPEPYVGNSDNSILWLFEDIEGILNSAKTVVIEVDQDYSTDYLIKKLMKQNPSINKQVLENIMKVMFWRIEEFKLRYKPFIVQMEDLYTIDGCKTLWEYLLPTIPFSEKRWKMLNEINIEVDDEKFTQDIYKGSGWFLLSKIECQLKRYT